MYRYIQATDEGVDEFHNEVKKLLFSRESNGERVVLFEDETGFSLHPKLGRIWGKKGTKSYIYTKSQHQKRLNLFGWVDPLKLNYQERLWRMLRYEETTNTYYETMVHLEVAVFSRSQRWKPQKLKRLCQFI